MMTTLASSETEGHDKDTVRSFSSLVSCFSMLDDPHLALDYLTLTRIHGSMWNASNLNSLLPVTNAAMETKANRDTGLKMMSLIASECASQVFQTQAQQWFNKAAQYVKPERLQTEPKAIAQASRLLCVLMKRARKEETSVAPIASKNITKSLPSVISKAIATLTAIHKDDSEIEISKQLLRAVDEALLRLMETILRYFPGQCNNFKANLENCLWNRLTRPPQLSRLKTSLIRCAAQMFRIGGSGRGGESIKTRWSDLFNRVLKELRKGIWTDQVENLNMAQQASLGQHRFVTMVELLRHLLLAPSSNEKAVDLSSVLKTFQKIFRPSVQELLKKGENDERALLEAFYLPSTLKTSLGFLTCLVQVLRSNLIPFVPLLINDIFVHTFNNLPHNYDSTFNSHCYEELKFELCSFLSSLLTQLHPQQGLEVVVKLLMREITPVQTQCLTLMSNKESNAEKKKKNLDKKLLSGDSGATKTSEVVMRSTPMVIEQTLCALKLCVQHCNLHVLNLNLFQDVEALVTSLALQPLPPLKSSSKCRLRLYELLQCVVVVAMSDCNTPSVLALASQALERGQNDKCVQVKAVCMEASLICSALMHPRAPGLNNMASKIVMQERMDQVTKIHVVEVVRESPFALPSLKRTQEKVINTIEKESSDSIEEDSGDSAKRAKMSSAEVDKDVQEESVKTDDIVDLEDDLGSKDKVASENDKEPREDTELSQSLSKEKLMSVFYDQSIAPIVIPEGAKESRKEKTVDPTTLNTEDDEKEKKRDVGGDLSAENVLKLFDDK